MRSVASEYETSVTLVSASTVTVVRTRSATRTIDTSADDGTGLLGCHHHSSMPTSDDWLFAGGAAQRTWVAESKVAAAAIPPTSQRRLVCGAKLVPPSSTTDPPTLGPYAGVKRETVGATAPS